MFHEITVSDLSFNPFTRLNKDWALVTVTDPDTGKVNTMTVSWGGVGVLWNKNVVTIYIRPQRYTHEFLEKNRPFYPQLLRYGSRRYASGTHRLRPQIGT